MTVENVNPDAGTAGAPTGPDTAMAEDQAMAAVWDKAQAATADTGEGGDTAPAGYVRGPDGKFVAKAATAAGEGASQEGEEGAAKPDAGSTVEAGLAAPAHLPQAIKASWDKIPEDARTAIAAHQQDMDRKFLEMGRTMAAVKPISDRFSAAVQQFPEFQGMTPEDMAEGAVQLAAVQSALERGSPEDRANMVLQIAQRYGVLPALASRLSGQSGGDQNTQVIALQQEIASLRQQISKPQIDPKAIEEHVSSALMSREIETEVEAFAGKADFWADVEGVIPHYIQMAKEIQPGVGIKQALALAYDMAINADPAVRQKARALEAQKATTAQPDTKLVDAAKKAASINVKSTTSGAGRTLSEDEELAAAFDRKMAS